MALSLIVSFHLSTCNLKIEIFFNTFQAVCDGVQNVLILAATNTPYALVQVRKKNTILLTYCHGRKESCLLDQKT